MLTVRIPRRPVKPPPSRTTGFESQRPQQFDRTGTRCVLSQPNSSDSLGSGPPSRRASARSRALARRLALQSCLRGSAVSTRLLSGEVQVRLLPGAPSLRVRGATDERSGLLSRWLRVRISPHPPSRATVGQWQTAGLPSRQREFDSRRSLHHAGMAERPRHRASNPRSRV
jgi:hypothetical protein